MIQNYRLYDIRRNLFPVVFFIEDVLLELLHGHDGKSTKKSFWLIVMLVEGFSSGFAGVEAEKYFVLVVISCFRIIDVNDVCISSIRIGSDEAVNVLAI